MSQVVYDSINPATTSGTQLASILDDFKDALMSGLTGTSRPTETTAGGSWIDTTNEGTPNFYWSFKTYTGSVDVEVFRVNLATNKASFAGSDSTFEVTRISADATGAIAKLIKQRVATNGQVLDGDTVGELQFIGRGSDSSNPIVARIRAIATDDMTGSATGTYLAFESTVDGVASAAEVMRIMDGKLGVGTQAPDSVIHADGATGIKASYVADNATGAKTTLQKARSSGDGSVQTSDVIGSHVFRAKDSAPAFSDVAEIDAIALEGHTAGAKGTKVRLKSKSTGTNTMTSKLEIGDKIESLITMKMNSQELVAQSIATAATIVQLSAAKVVVEFTGSTATSLQGINSAHDSKVILLHNISTVDVTLENENAGATAADRLKLPNASPITLSPQSSVELFYSTTDSRWKIKSGAGSGSASSGGKNYASVLFGGNSVANINQYADSGATPTDGTGGSPAGLTTAVNTASSPLRPSGNQRFSKDGSNRQGSGWSWDFPVDRADYEGGKPLVVQFRMKTSSGYVNNDVRMFVYDKDGTVLLNVNSLTGDGSLSYSPSTGLFTGVFYPNSANDDYRLIWHIASTTAAAWDLDIIDLKVGPDSVVPGAINAQSVSYTPTFVGFGTVTGIGAMATRRGNMLRVDFAFTTGTVTAVEATMTLPPNLNIDTSILSGVKLRGELGNNSGVASTYVVSNTATATDKVYFAVISNPTATINGNTSPFANSQNQTGWFEVPISQWLASAALTTTEAILSTVRAKYSLTSATANNSFADNAFEIADYDTKIYDTHNAVTTGAAWKFTAPKTGHYQVKTYGRWATSTNMDSSAIDIYKNGVSTEFIFVSSGAGQYIMHAVSTTLYLVKGDYIDLRWFQDDSTSAARAPHTSSVRVFVEIEELPDFSIFSVFGQSEYLESKSSSVVSWPITAAEFGDLTSLVLTPGEWDLTAVFNFDNNGAVTAGIFDCGISTTTGNSGSGLNFAENRVRADNRGTTLISSFAAVPNYRVSITATTTFYLKGSYSSAITNLRLLGYRLSARRIK